MKYGHGKLRYKEEASELVLGLFAGVGVGLVGGCLFIGAYAIVKSGRETVPMQVR